jgi:hypothetical protein
MTGKVVETFCIPAFIWQPIGVGLLNLVKLAENLYFFGDFFSKFQGICGKIFL